MCQGVARSAGAQSVPKLSVGPQTQYNPQNLDKTPPVSPPKEGETGGPVANSGGEEIIAALLELMATVLKSKGSGQESIQDPMESVAMAQNKRGDFPGSTFNVQA